MAKTILFLFCFGMQLAAQSPAVQSVLNSASYRPQVAPGTWVAIFGTQLAPSALAASATPFPAQLNGVSVTFAAKPAPLSYVSPGQVNALIPFDAANLTAVQTAIVPVVVTTDQGASKPFNLILQRNAPALYSANGRGSGDAVAFDGNFQPITTVDGSAIVVYATGLGPTTPPANTNAVAYADGVLNRASDTVGLNVGGNAAELLYAGLAPGLQGIYQLNFRPKRPFANNAISLTAGSYPAPALTLPVPPLANVDNLNASIASVFPADGGLTQWDSSELPMVAHFNVDFDIKPSAAAFAIAANYLNGTALITVDPAAKTWTSVVSVPTAAARQGDFSALTTQVFDFLGGGFAFPGNVIPASRLNPTALAALNRLPLPNAPVPAGTVNGTYTSTGTIPPNNHLTFSTSFGYFQVFAKGISGTTYVAAYNLTVDVMGVGSGAASVKFF